MSHAAHAATVATVPSPQKQRTFATFAEVAVALGFHSPDEPLPEPPAEEMASPEATGPTSAPDASRDGDSWPEWPDLSDISRVPAQETAPEDAIPLAGAVSGTSPDLPPGELPAADDGDGREPIPSPAIPHVAGETAPLDLSAVLAELRQASDRLATIARQDAAARAAALQDLEAYDAAAAAHLEAETAHAQAAAVRQDAERLLETAFAGEARAAAASVLELARRAETEAARIAAERLREKEMLEAGPAVSRLLEERRQAAAAEEARAAAADGQRRLSGALAAAREALTAGRFEEARSALGSVASEFPNDDQIASLTQSIARCEQNVKLTAADEALWAVRRALRRDPAAAVARLEALDVAGLPEDLARQVFGEWARACARLCRERGLVEPLRYAPDPGRGAVLARDGAGAPHRVLSAIGMGPAWVAGSLVCSSQLRRARPLR